MYIGSGPKQEKTREFPPAPVSPGYGLLPKCPRNGFRCLLQAVNCRLLSYAQFTGCTVLSGGLFPLSFICMATSHLLTKPTRVRKGNGTQQRSNPEGQNPKQTNQECPRPAWHRASQLTPRIWTETGLWLKLWSLGLGLWAGPVPWARAWA